MDYTRWKHVKRSLCIYKEVKHATRQQENNVLCHMLSLELYRTLSNASVKMFLTDWKIKYIIIRNHVLLQRGRHEHN